MGIELLGPLRIDGREASMQRRDQVVLSALAVRNGEGCSADQLAEALWGEAPPTSWPKQIQGCVVRLRRTLGPSAIETTAAGYRLATGNGDLDTRQFEELVTRGNELADGGEPDRAAVFFERALELWRGAPFQVLDGWSPGQVEAARLTELRLTAEEGLLEARLQAGEHRDVVARAEARVAEQPLREHRWALLATSLYRCGRQADALRAIRQARHTLRDQLGLEAGPELVALEAAILNQDESLLAAPAGTVSTECPYKGLAPYDADDSEGFFGRDADVRECLARLADHPLLVVTGPSGSGKSSLVRAGLVPALRRSGRTVVTFTPGTDPAGLMTSALAAGGDPAPVLVVDQFEEAFTSADGSVPAGAADFCARLGRHAVEIAPVIVAVRADHLASLSADADFARLAEHGIHLVTPLAGESLRLAIEGPAAAAGLRLEHGLTDLLMRDCEGSPGALPLLSHALAETWQRRDGRVLTVDGYHATGEIRGAVARSADRLYESLPVEQRSKLRAVMLRLVSVSPDGEPVRTRVARHTLSGDADRERVITLLVNARLVTADQESVELAHEVLVRAWPRLQSWLDEDAAGQRLLRHLSTAAEEWDSLGRPTSELYRGARLDAALEWRTATAPDLTDVEEEFLASSVMESASERMILAEQAREQARQNRRLRLALVMTGALLVVALVGGFIAVDQREVARRERRASTARELAAASTASLAEDPQRAILLALAAVDTTRSSDGPVLPEAESALHDAVSASRQILSVPGVGGALAWSPTGEVFVTEGPEESGLIDIRDATTGASVRAWRGHDADVNHVAFSADGSMLATTGDDHAVRVWDSATGDELWTFTGPRRPEEEGDGFHVAEDAWGPAFSPDGSLLAVAWYDHDVVRVVDLTTGEVAFDVAAPNGYDLAFSPDGERLVVGNEEEPSALVVDTSSGRALFTIGGDEGWIREVAWSPDGSAIATTGGAGIAHVWNAANGEQRHALAGHSGPVSSVAWSPDSERVATVGEDGTARVWRISDDGARQELVLSGQDTRNGLQSVAFSPDGDRLMTSDFGVSAVSVWDVRPTGGGEWTNIPAVPANRSHKVVAFTGDGRRVAVSTPGGVVTLWDVVTEERRMTFEPPPAAAWDYWLVHVSPDDQLLAAAGGLNVPLTVWDLATGAEVFTVPPGVGGAVAWDLDWSPDSQRLAVLYDPWHPDTVVSILDRSGTVVATVREDPGFTITSVSFSHDGRQLAVARTPADRDDPTATSVRIWDWERGQVVRTIDTPARRAVFDPTGQLLAVNRWPAGDLETWDPTTGELVATLAGHTSQAADLSFSADGSRLVTAGTDGTVRLWDPHTGRQELVLRHTEGEVGTARFSPDGSRVASAGADGLVRIWALDLDDVIAIAQDRLTRGFTDEECRQYLRLETCPAEAP